MTNPNGPILRSKRENKIPLKEKIVAIHENIFKGKDPSVSQPRFWEELFLLKVNIPYLKKCVESLSEDQLITLHPILNKLFHHALLALQDSSIIRNARSIETFSVLFHELFKKSFKEFGLNLFTIVCGMDNADTYFIAFLNACKKILENNSLDLEIRSGMINLLLIISTATDNINQNVLLDYFMQVNLFTALLHVLIEDNATHEMKYSVLVILSLLSYYHKYEQKNEYYDSFTHIDVPDVITSHIDVLSAQFEHLKASGEELEGSTTFEKITSYFTFWMPSTPTTDEIPITPKMGSFLLSLYDWVHTNGMYRKAICSSHGTATIFGPDPSQTTELLQNILQFAAGIFSDVHNLYQACYTKLCMIIFLCLTEDKNSAVLLHNSEIGCYISTPLNKSKLKKTKKSVVCVILDLAVQFLKTNLKKKMQFGLYLRALNIIQRVICFGKKSSVNIHYKWKQVWDVLFTVIKFISTPEMFAHTEIIQISTEITTIFNLFITYGDSLLEETSDYDELFYQIIHQTKLLSRFHNIAEGKRSCTTLVQLQENITTIIRHFNSKLDHWQTEHPNATLTQDMVIEIIKNNYGSLKLNLFDGLDHFENYIENPKEIAFFRQFSRMISSMDWDDSALIEAYDAAVAGYKDNHDINKKTNNQPKNGSKKRKTPPTVIDRPSKRRKHSQPSTPVPEPIHAQQFHQTAYPMSQPLSHFLPSSLYYPAAPHMYTNGQYQYPNIVPQTPVQQVIPNYQLPATYTPTIPNASPQTPNVPYPQHQFSPSIPIDGNPELSRILMAWYNAGYSTGRYQALEEIRATKK